MSIGHQAALVFIKSEGDIDLQTPLYEMGVQGVFTRSLDIALLNGSIDVAVHSMKDVPTQLPDGIIQAAVLPRASYKDILVYKGSLDFMNDPHSVAVIATSSIRRKAQWLNRFQHHEIVNFRGNVNTRLQKAADHSWNGAIFAAAGVERIGVRPGNSIDLDWMLPAPAQGAILVVSRLEDTDVLSALASMHDEHTSLCANQERSFLRSLMGGCATPISALAEVIEEQVHFRGSILSVDGKEKAEVELWVPIHEANHLGENAAIKIQENGGKSIAMQIRNAGK
jgi:hydroxymethylbilane synthase